MLKNQKSLPKPARIGKKEHWVGTVSQWTGRTQIGKYYPKRCSESSIELPQDTIKKDEGSSDSATMKILREIIV